MDIYIYISELRIASKELDILDTENIRPSSKSTSICHAGVRILSDRNGAILKMSKVKLDSCGSVSKAKRNSIRPAKGYNLPNIRLKGIGEKTNMLKKVGIKKIKRPDAMKLANYYVKSLMRS
jgi:hypothetical protein